MTPTKKFKRNEEDFACERCSFAVQGNGYTNHCPQCLWSKHVDINPGDRAAICKGMMEPIDAAREGEEYMILHRCAMCGFERKNKTSRDDNFDAILQLSQSE